MKQSCFVFRSISVLLMLLAGVRVFSQENFSVNDSTANWNDFAFVFCYGEIDPFAKPWDPDRYPAFLQAINKMGANIAVPMVTWTAPDRWRTHPWTEAWLSYSGNTVSPWYLWIDMANKAEPNHLQPMGCYNNPAIKPHFLEILQKTKEIYGEGIVQFNGRPVINFEKENAYTFGNHDGTHPLAQHFCPHCQHSFIMWLKDWYDGDLSRLNEECGTSFTAWNKRVWRYIGSVKAEEEFRLTVRNKHEYPMLNWLWQRWIDDNVWGDTYGAVADELRIWQLCVQHTPSRYLSRQPFFLDNGLTLVPDYTGDYWTRRDPDKIGIAYYNGLYQTNAVVGDPYHDDRFMARTFGQISRMRGVYRIGFDHTHSDIEYNAYQVSMMFFPKTMEALSWWAHTIRGQKQLFDQLLTYPPQVAVYPGETSTFPAYSGYGALYGKLAAAGYPAHFLDRDMIVDGALKDYRVLLMHGERIPMEVLDAIKSFKDDGGYVAGFFNAGTWSLTRQEPGWFQSMFDAQFTRMIKTEAAIVRQPEEPPFFTAKEDQSTSSTGYPFLYEMDAASALAKDVRSYWESGVLHDDALMLARPVGGKAIASITSVPEDIVPIENDETCMVLSRDGRGLFLGMHQGGHSTMRIKLITNFIENAGAQKAVNCSGMFVDSFQGPVSLDSTEAYRLLSEDGNLQLFVLINNDTDQTVPAELQIPAALTQSHIVELKTLETLALADAEKLKLDIPPGQVRMILFGPENITSEVLQVQRRVNEEARVFPWHCSRHFFLRRHVTNAESWHSVRGDLTGKYMEMEAWPNALIVLGENASTDDRQFAADVVKIIEDWPMASNRIVLPVKTAGELTLAEKEEYNLLLVGDTSENSVTKAEFERVQSSATEGIFSHHERGWYTGDNFVAVLGRNGNRIEEFAEFIEWMHIWLDGAHKHFPGRQP